MIPSDSEDNTETPEVTAEGGHGAVPTTGVETGRVEKGEGERPSRRTWPLYEVFVRGKRGLNHVHVGSLHAADAEMALHNARDLYTRRNEGVSIWVVKAEDITASSPAEKDPFFAPAADKVYRHPTFYAIPEEVPHL
jgi:ring-1,2-phenylacetyl-CoA epoxidase subunit PaaB